MARDIFAVKRRNGIRAPRELQAKHGHAELLVMVAGILASELHQLLVRDPETVADRAEMFFNQIGSETGRAPPEPVYAL